MDKDALRAAALLGDPSAARELKHMTDNATTVTLWVAGFLSITSVIVAVILAVADYNRGRAQIDELEAQHRASTDAAASKARAELQLMWAKTCKLTPDQIEKVTQ